MKREIKFRAWIKDEKKMIDVTSIYFDGYDGFEVSNLEYEALDHLEVELMQYTGLKDKNGVEIFESDIVKCHDHPTGMEDCIGEVSFNNGIYKVGDSMIPLHDFGTVWTEVIGNIYENPELL